MGELEPRDGWQESDERRKAMDELEETMREFVRDLSDGRVDILAPDYLDKFGQAEPKGD